MSDMLSIGSSGINAYQRALATVSNNIANATTDGYSRQDVTLSANSPQRVGTNYLGTGAVINGTRRQYDAFVDLNLRTSNSELKAQEPLVTYVNRLIDIMGDESIGLTTAMNQFFAAGRDLATDPASTVQRSTFLRNADGLAARFRQLDGQFELLDNETRQAVQSDVGKINSLTSQLAELNKQMTRHSSEADQPSELLDQRDKLLRELSTLTGIKTHFSQNGTVLVSVGDVISQGVLVEGNKSRDIGLANATGGANGQLQFVIDPYGATESLPNLGSGHIGGLLSFRESVLKPAVDSLNNIAQVVADQVNGAHRAGIDIEARSGTDLFTIGNNARGAAAGIQVAITDTSRIAAAGQFRITDDTLNTSQAQATVSWSQPNFEGPTTLGKSLSQGQVPQIPTDTFSIGKTEPYVSLGAVPLGTQDLTLTLQQPAAGQTLQVLTRDGRHLLGTPLSEAQQKLLMKASNGMEEGATYSAASMNGRYMGMDLFLGARAGVQYLQQFNEATGKLADPLPVAAVLQGKTLPSGLTGPIAANTFTLNGVSLDTALSTTGPLTANDVVTWLNTYTASTGVTASVVNGGIQLARPDSDVTNDIRLGVGSAGQASDLTALGFDQSLYVNGSSKDDLLVFVTTTGPSPATVAASAQFISTAADPAQARAQALRAQPLVVKFTSATRYQILDQGSGTVLADRPYSATQSSIQFRGLSIAFSSAPGSGDSYVIDSNADGIGNNEALLKLVSLEGAKLMPGDLTMTEAYIEKVNDVGNLAQQAKIAKDALQVVYNQAVDARDGISGVSLDQEASDLVRFQQAYQANAKVMQVANDLFDAILRVS